MFPGQHWFVSRFTFYRLRPSDAPQICVKFRTWHEEGRRLVVRVACDFQAMFQHQNGHAEFLSRCELYVLKWHSQFDNIPMTDRLVGADLLPGSVCEFLREQKL